QNVDSEDYKSHVMFSETGPDNGMCDDLNYPITIPQIFMDVSACLLFVKTGFRDQQGETMTPWQPFV
ncbi:hypothetical protein EV421DRAFT_1697710, partial [Armillaria borealis]